MIVVRAPLRISFVGGGTDLPDFYSKHAGRVISTSIDKFIYVAVNKNLRNNVLVKYSITEEVPTANDLKHTRVKAALLDLGIHDKIEIASLADVSAKSGLGSSSSFSVALLKALNAFLGKNSFSKKEAADAACRLEIHLLKEPIGKQDQYAASFGGLNVLNFNNDGSVDVEPVLIDFEKKSLLEKHMLVFLTGQFRDASQVLGEQKKFIGDKTAAYKKMANLVYPFRDALLVGNMKIAGEVLDENWQIKKTLASNVSNPVIDEFYAAGMGAGALGGKILGAGGGGSLLFLAPPEKHAEVIKKVSEVAAKNNLTEFRQLPVKLVDCGADIVFRGDHHYNNFV